MKKSNNTSAVIWALYCFNVEQFGAMQFSSFEKQPVHNMEKSQRTLLIFQERKTPFHDIDQFIIWI